MAGESCVLLHPGANADENTNNREYGQNQHRAGDVLRGVLAILQVGPQVAARVLNQCPQRLIELDELPPEFKVDSSRPTAILTAPV